MNVYTFTVNATDIGYAENDPNCLSRSKKNNILNPGQNYNDNWNVLGFCSCPNLWKKFSSCWKEVQTVKH